MDPDAKLQQILAAIYECDHEALVERATEMGEWLFTGGFAPEVTNDQLMVIMDALADLAKAAGDSWEVHEAAAELRALREDKPSYDIGKGIPGRNE